MTDLLHPCCPDTDLIIDGVYGDPDAPYAVAWTCPIPKPICGTSGGTLWHLAPEWMKEKGMEKG